MKPETILRYAHDLYNALLDKATTQPEGGWLFVGSVTDVYNELKLSSSVYSHVRKMLTSDSQGLGEGDQPCIEFVQRGNRATPSVILLHHPPPDLPPADFTFDHLTDRETIDTLREKVETLETRLDEYMGFNVKEALRNHEKRIKRIELERVIHGNKK